MGGKVSIWNDGFINELLPDTNVGPKTKDILRAVEVTDGILFQLIDRNFGTIISINEYGIEQI